MRLATKYEVPLFMAALLDVKAKSPNPHMRYAEPMDAELGLHDFIHRECAVVVGDYLILYDVGKVWYSPALFLFETLVLRFKRDEGTPVSAVTDALDALREQHGCDAIVVGDTQIGRMAKHYEAAGWQPIGVQLLKG